MKVVERVDREAKEDAADDFGGVSSEAGIAIFEEGENYSLICAFDCLHWL
jgi:hypothetical protein